jgi:hypothetical protein
MKDANDAKAQLKTEKAIDSTVRTSTANASRTIIKIVDDANGRELDSVRTVIAAQRALGSQTAQIAKGAGDILTDIDKTLYPFKDVSWAYEVRFNLSHPMLRHFKELLRQKAKDLFDQRPNFGAVYPGQNRFEDTPDTSIYLFQRYGQRKRLLMWIDAPFLRADKYAFGAVLGYGVFVDIFKAAPPLQRLSDFGFRSSDYAVLLLPPYNNDTYWMARSANEFPMDNYRQFELIYIPPSAAGANDDECYVDYYWHAMEKFDIITEPSRASIAGLPDLRGSQYIVRLESLSDWEGIPPYALSSLRMRVGSLEMTLSAKAFRSRRDAHGYLIYQKTLPARFDQVLNLFDAIRSPEDTAPLSHLRLQLRRQ